MGICRDPQSCSDLGENWVPYKTRSSGGAVGGVRWVRWGAVKIFVQYL